MSLDKRLPEWPVFSLLGDASYAIYLSHLFVIIGFLLVMGTDEGGTLTGLAVLFTSALVGIVVHLHVDVPLKRLIECAEAGWSNMTAWRRGEWRRLATLRRE